MKIELKLHHPMNDHIRFHRVFIPEAGIAFNTTPKQFKDSKLGMADRFFNTCHRELILMASEHR
jgi:hypothetical protein